MLVTLKSNTFPSPTCCFPTLSLIGKALVKVIPLPTPEVSVYRKVIDPVVTVLSVVPSFV